MQTKLLLGLFLFCSLAGFSQVPAYMPSSGLLAWYPFNGNYNNQSGSNTNHLSNAGAMSFTSDRNGTANSSANFSGNSNAILTLNSPTFSFSPTGEWSISYYVRRDDGSSTTRISMFSGNQNSNAFQWLLSHGTIGCQKTGGSWTWNTVSAQNTTWDHFVFTYKDGRMRVYKNGSSSNSTNYNKQGNTNTHKLWIGTDPQGQRWKGQIDDIAIYNRELSSSEIGSLYNQCNSATQGGSVSGPSSVCSGTNSSSLSLTGYTGTISKWQSSTDNSNWNDVSSSSGQTSITVSNLTATRYYRAEVTRSNCPTANSGVFTISTTIKKWIGNSNTQFSNASNWCGGVPSATEVVEIQNVARAPQLTDNRTFGGLILNGNLDLNGNQITINGPISGTGGFVSHSNSRIILGSSVTSDSLKFVDNNPIIKTLQLNSNVNLKLNKNLNIRDSLVLNNGKLTIGNNHVSAKSIVTASNSNYVQTNGTGKLYSAIGTTQKILPVGNSSYNPITISLQSGVDSFGVSISDQIRTLGTSGTALTNGNVQATWDIQRVAQNGSPVNLSFAWNASQEQTGFNRSLCYASHYNSVSQAWEKLASGSKSATGAGPYQLSYTNYTGTFSPFGVGSGNGALPVELKFFNVKKSNNEHVLFWETASEKQFSHFEIQQSTDGKTFHALEKVASKGGNASMYETRILENRSGEFYYRLAMVDLDGSVHYSTIQKLVVLNQTSIQLYPNPVQDQLIVQMDGKKSGQGKLSIYNILGKMVYQQTIWMKDGEQTIQLPIFDQLPSGTYSLQIENQGEMIQQKVIKK